MKLHPFVESQDLLDQPTTLRKRLQEDGYLFFENLIDRGTLQSLLVDVLDRL